MSLENQLNTLLSSTALDEACGLAQNPQKVNERTRRFMLPASTTEKLGQIKCKFSSFLLFWQEAFYESISTIATSVAQSRS
jgi:hypothetical protein